MINYPARLRNKSLLLAAGYSPRQCGLDASWHVVNERILLGYGPAAFEAASERLLGWRAHAQAGVRVEAPHPPVAGMRVPMRFGPMRLDCEVVSVARGVRSRWGTAWRQQTWFVYGTLERHPERGEEAFVVTFEEATGAVFGQCVAFSQQATWLTRVGAPVARRVQAAVTRRYLEGMRPGF